MRLARLAAVVLATGALATIAPARHAWADPPGRAATPIGRANAEILVIHATKAPPKGPMDERLARLPQLTQTPRQKPFSDFSSFTVLDQKVIPLVKGEPATYGLVTGRTLRVTLRDVTADKRYAVDAAIDRPPDGGARGANAEYLKLLEVVAAPNEPFFVGGQSYKGGSLILAITIRP